jgi:Retinal pigment epithelial membrane protein
MADHFKENMLRNSLNGTDGQHVPDKQNWPPAPSHFSFDDPQVLGFHRPTRFEGDVNNLEVIGDIPKELNGTFYRVMPDPQFPSFIGNDVVSHASHFLPVPTVNFTRRSNKA